MKNAVDLRFQSRQSFIQRASWNLQVVSPAFRALLVAISSIAGANVFAAAGEPSQHYVWKNAQIVGGGFVSGIITHPSAKNLMYARTDIGGAYRRTSSTGPWVPITDWIDQAHWTYEGTESLAIDASDPKYVYIAGGCYTNKWSGLGAILRSADQGETFAVTPMPFKMGGNENGRGMGERLVVDPNNGLILFFGSRKNGLWRSEDRGVTWKQVDTFPRIDDTKGMGIETLQFDTSAGKVGTATPLLFAGVGSHKTNIYQSSDCGLTWRSISNQPTGMIPHHIVSDNHGTLYVTYGNGPGPNDVTDGAVYKYEVATSVWTNITPIAPSSQDKFGYAGLTLDPQRNGVIMVSTLDRWKKTDDLFRSVDGGAHWVGLRDQSVRDWSAAPWLLLGKDKVGIGHWICNIQIDPFDSDHLLYVTGWGMWESHDLTSTDRSLATHWQVAAQGIEEGVMNDLISPPSGSHVLTAMWDIDGFRHLDLDRSPATGSLSPHYGGNTSIDFAENNANIIVRAYGAQPVGEDSDAGTCGSYSEDNGATWSAFKSRAPGKKGDETIAVSSNGGTFISTFQKSPSYFSNDRGSHWNQSSGLPTSLRVISDRSDPNDFYACDMENGVFYASDDRGASFQSRATKLPSADGYLRAVPGHKGHLWLGSANGLFASSDSGSQFVPITSVQSAHRLGFGKAAPGQDYPAIYIAGVISNQYGFYRSDDEGKSWTRINDDHHQFAEIAAISGDPRIYGRIYIASRSRGTIFGDIGGMVSP